MTPYIENAEMKDFPEFDHVFDRFQKKGILKPENQMKIYRAISLNWCVGKAVLDVGCGIGIGTNILSWDALGTFGIDNNPLSIRVAKQFYEGPRLKFDTYDITAPPERPVGSFDVVVCIEVIEHIKDYDVALQNLKRFYEPKRKTIFFISSPNRNNPQLSKEKPNNAWHVREFTAGEFYNVLTKHFSSVVMYSGDKITNFTQDETVDGNTEDSPVVAKCEMPL